jgi:hypothetical protein
LLNAIPQLFLGLILITPFTPFDKSDVTVTLAPPAIQFVPVETDEPIDH